MERLARPRSGGHLTLLHHPELREQRLELHRAQGLVARRGAKTQRTAQGLIGRLVRWFERAEAPAGGGTRPRRGRSCRGAASIRPLLRTPLPVRRVHHRHANRPCASSVTRQFPPAGCLDCLPSVALLAACLSIYQSGREGCACQPATLLVLLLCMLFLPRLPASLGFVPGASRVCLPGRRHVRHTHLLAYDLLDCVCPILLLTLRLLTVLDSNFPGNPLYGHENSTP